MINVDAIKELIDQAPEIKTLFTIESYPMASMYDYNTGTHKTSSINLQTIYKNPEEIVHFTNLCDRMSGKKDYPEDTFRWNIRRKER